MMNHPEQTKNERFIGNTTPEKFETDEILRGLRTARMGNIAYDINGNRLKPEENRRPLIIGESEYDEYNRKMMQRFNEIKRKY